MRAVALGADGRPSLADVAEPPPPGELVTVLACGLCGSDVEKIGVWPSGSVLGHEVVALTDDGRRVALIHHSGCGECSRCRAGHESTCERFPEPTIVPGGFAERVRASGWVELPGGVGRRARDVRGAARVRAARGGEGAARAGADRGQRLHRTAVRCRARGTRGHGVRGRRAPASSGRRARRAGRRRRAVRARAVQTSRSRRSSREGRCCSSPTPECCRLRRCIGVS